MATDDETGAARWDSDQLRTDEGAEDPLPQRSPDVPADADEAIAADAQAAEPVADDAQAEGDAPDWNKGQMATDDAGEGQTWIDPDTMPESEMGATGGRANPGGGQRFGERDDTPAEDPS